ncbi:MAG TPA: xanthine dehydrogenase family protein molybdopterin-binding subunit [Xanthobacteraceae bacterium]
MPRFIGKSIPRLEDERFVTGRGRYTNDIPPPDACWAYVLRSPHAHAHIRAIGTGPARTRPGVLTVLTAEDYARDGHKGIFHFANTSDALEPQKPAFGGHPDHFVFEQPQAVLASDRVRFVGEPVALIVARTLDQARDAAEAIEVDYQVLPAVVTIADALAPSAPRLWDGAPGNVSLRARYGDAAAVAKSFAAAALVIERDLPNQRIVNCQMEPRAAIGLYDQAADCYTLIAGSQGVTRHRGALSGALGVPPANVRVISPDVGGGFGSRSLLYPEYALVVWAAKRLKRPVRWNSDRSEAFLSDFQGRDLAIRIAGAFNRRGRLLAARFAIDGNLGAHPAAFVSLNNYRRLATTVYDLRLIDLELRAVLTNSTPTCPFRGAGRPEAMFVMERLFDLAADRLHIDRIEIRRRNLIGKSQLPYRNAMGLTYDSGDFHGNMAAALARAEWKSFPQRRKESRRAGRLRGVGVANYIEAPVGAPFERVVLTVKADGQVEMICGTQSSGQGHETVFAQVAADLLDVPLMSVKLVTGDTTQVEKGGGSHSARSMRLVGTLLVEACGKILKHARGLAAEAFGASETEINYSDGFFSTPKSNRAFSLFDLAERIAPAGLSAMAELSHRIPAHPTGCAVCELEVDPQTGVVDIKRYTSVDDVGVPINPMLVDGQMHGGIVQGIGQALSEGVAVDRSGQVVNASFMDYGLPRADSMPCFDVALALDPTAGNPLGIKGGGEGGITPAAAAVINALVDALKEFGIDHVDMPATPLRVWTAIENAKRGKPGS